MVLTLTTRSPVHFIIHIFPVETSVFVTVELFQNKIKKKKTKTQKIEEKILFEFN